MINQAADNYGMILPANQETGNAKKITTGNLDDFAFQETHPPAIMSFISSTADDFQLITNENQNTANQYTDTPVARGPVGVNAGLHPMPYQYNMYGKIV